MLNIKKQIISYFNNYRQAYRNQISKSLNNPKITTTSNLDPKKVHDLLIYQYSKTFLEDMRQSLEQAYTREREKEKDVKIHSEKHREIVQRMHDITENITKINYELANLTNCTEEITDKDLHEKHAQVLKDLEKRADNVQNEFNQVGKGTQELEKEFDIIKINYKNYLMKFHARSYLVFLI